MRHADTFRRSHPRRKQQDICCLFPFDFNLERCSTDKKSIYSKYIKTAKKVSESQSGTRRAELLEDDCLNLIK
ncbi:hypothetical protein Bpfe_002539, partial [Biomphalaria pfeifferi]